MTKEEKEMNVISQAVTLLRMNVDNINRLAENQEEASELFNTHSCSVIASIISSQWCAKHKTHDFPEEKMKSLYSVSNFLCGLIDECTDDLEDVFSRLVESVESVDEVQE